MRPRTCGEVRADLSAYLDDDLGPARAGETRAHLERCADCRSELDLLRRTVAALRRLPELPPPAAIITGVRARLRPDPWYRRLLEGRRWPLGVPIGALATVLVIVGISLFPTRHSDISQTVPRGPSPQAPAPHAKVMPAAPTPGATTAPATRPVVADRRPAAPVRKDFRAPGAPGSATLPQQRGREKEFAARESSAVAGADRQDRDRNTPATSVERSAPTELKAAAEKAERIQPSRQEAPDDTASAGLRSGMLAKQKTEKPIIVEAVFLLPAAGYTVEDIERLLRREGAGNIAVSVLEPRAVHEAFASHRLQRASLPEPSQGWAVTASVPAQALTRLFDTLTSRTDLRILKQPAAPNGREDQGAPSELRVTVLR